MSEILKLEPTLDELKRELEELEQERNERLADMGEAIANIGAINAELERRERWVSETELDGIPYEWAASDATAKCGKTLSEYAGRIIECDEHRGRLLNLAEEYAISLAQDAFKAAYERKVS